MNTADSDQVWIAQEEVVAEGFWKFSDQHSGRFFLRLAQADPTHLYVGGSANAREVVIAVRQLVDEYLEDQGSTGMAAALIRHNAVGRIPEMLDVLAGDNVDTKAALARAYSGLVAENPATPYPFMEELGRIVGRSAANDRDGVDLPGTLGL